MRRIGRLLIVASIGTLLAVFLAGAVAVELALHLRRRPVPQTVDAIEVARESGSAWEAVRISAEDGAVLRAWLFTPGEPNGSAVLLLHGVNDTRTGMLDHARYLLRSGFIVLIPDSRGHGESGGAIATYGIKEADDVERWTGWLLQVRGVERLYGLGMSLGGAILLQSLVRDSSFRAVVAESPFASFPEIAYDRLAKFSGINRHLFWPVIQSGFLYARFRYGVDLRRASPAAALPRSRTPVLLIHGIDDEKTPIRHSRELHTMNPDATRLWEVTGARHTKALSTQPEAYARTVVEWFRSHP